MDYLGFDYEIPEELKKAYFESLITPVKIPSDEPDIQGSIDAVKSAASQGKTGLGKLGYGILGGLGEALKLFNTSTGQKLAAGIMSRGNPYIGSAFLQNAQEAKQGELAKQQGALQRELARRQGIADLIKNDMEFKRKIKESENKTKGDILVKQTEGEEARKTQKEQNEFNKPLKERELARDEKKADAELQKYLNKPDEERKAIAQTIADKALKDRTITYEEYKLFLENPDKYIINNPKTFFGLWGGGISEKNQEIPKEPNKSATVKTTQITAGTTPSGINYEVNF